MGNVGDAAAPKKDKKRPILPNQWNVQRSHLGKDKPFRDGSRRAIYWDCVSRLMSTPGVWTFETCLLPRSFFQVIADLFTQRRRGTKNGHKGEVFPGLVGRKILPLSVEGGQEKVLS